MGGGEGGAHPQHVAVGRDGQGLPRRHGAVVGGDTVADGEGGAGAGDGHALAPGGGVEHGGVGGLLKDVQVVAGPLLGGAAVGGDDPIEDGGAAIIHLTVRRDAQRGDGAAVAVDEVSIHHDGADGVLDVLVGLKEVGVDDGQGAAGVGGDVAEVSGGVELVAHDGALHGDPGIAHVHGDDLGADGAGGQGVAPLLVGHRLDGGLGGGQLGGKGLHAAQAGEAVLVHGGGAHHHDLVGGLIGHGEAQILGDEPDRYEGAVVPGLGGHVHGDGYPVHGGLGGAGGQLHLVPVQGAQHPVGGRDPLHGAAEGLQHPPDGQQGVAAAVDLDGVGGDLGVALVHLGDLGINGAPGTAQLQRHLGGGGQHRGGQQAHRQAEGQEDPQEMFFLHDVCPLSSKI